MSFHFTFLLTIFLGLSAVNVTRAQMFAVRVDGRVGFIDKQGALVIKPQFEDAGDFKNGLAPVRVEGKWGFIKSTGHFQIPPQFDWLHWEGFNEGVCPAGIDGNKGAIDLSGNFVIEPKYEMALKFSDGVIPVRIEKLPIWGERWIYLDRTGKRAIEEEFYGADSFVDGRSFVKVGFDEWALIDKTGREITKKRFTYDPFDKFSEGLTAVNFGKKWGYINRDGRIVIEPKFDDANNFSEGLAAVQVGCYYGFINATGEFLIPPQFASAWKFSDGLAPVALANKTTLGLKFKSKGRWIQTCGMGHGSAGPQGYIDKTGKVVIEPKFGRAFLFSEGLAMVSFGEPHDVIGAIGKRGYIDKKGNYIWKPTE